MDGGARASQGCPGSPAPDPPSGPVPAAGAVPPCAAAAHTSHTCFLDAIVENLDSAVIACDAGGRISLMNRSARALSLIHI